MEYLSYQHMEPKTNAALQLPFFTYWVWLEHFTAGQKSISWCFVRFSWFNISLLLGHGSFANGDETISHANSYVVIVFLKWKRMGRMWEW